MVIVILALLGLCLGSFVNALVWRVRQQERQKKSKRLSVINGRSMCTDCQHTLAWYDLIPVVSWLLLQGRCRYCKKPISLQYPLVELAAAGLFVGSYLVWPRPLDWQAITSLALWLITLTGLIALFVYDLKWMKLPNRILFPLYIPGTLYATITVISADKPALQLVQAVGAVAALGGLFWVLFQVSKGKWIGGGDVKLGFLLGLLAGSVANAVFLLFLASVLGTLYAIPLMMTHKAKTTTRVAFGPFLILACLVAVLYGPQILDWYNRLFIGV